MNSNATTRELRLEAEFGEHLRHQFPRRRLDTETGVELGDAFVEERAERRRTR